MLLTLSLSKGEERWTSLSVATTKLRRDWPGERKILILRQAQDENFGLLIFKIVPRAEWEASSGDYHGSAHDQADGFLHFSTEAQLPETLRRYYAGKDDLILVAVDAATLGAALKWEYSPSRAEDFPHLYAPLSRDAMKWARAIAKDAAGNLVLPLL